VIFFLVVAGRFLRRSGSRVSIPNACRHTVLWHPVSAKTLCPLGQPEKALGHEPQIEPWLTPYNRNACSVSQTDWRRRITESHAEDEEVRSVAQQNVSSGAQGWKSRNFLPVMGEVFLLTFPFIEQPIAVTILAVRLLV